MKFINSKSFLLSAFLLVAMVFTNVNDAFAAKKLDLNVKNRRAISGVYYADLYVTVPSGVTWTVVSQTIVLNYNSNALDIGQFDGDAIINQWSDFTGYSVFQTDWATGQISFNALKTFPPFSTISDQEVMLGTLRWDIVDGTLMDDLEFNTGECQLVDDQTQLSYNENCDQETCFTVTSITSQQVELPVPTLDSPTDMTYGSDLSVDLMWNDVNHEAVDSYDVQVSTDPGFSTFVIDDNTTNLQWSLTGLSNGTQYYWRVRSRDEDQSITSDWSSEWMFKTKLAPATLASPADGSMGISLTPALNWNAVAGADGYEVELYDAGGQIVFSHFVLSGTSYDITQNDGLQNYTEYDWYVVAFEEHNQTTFEADPSATWSFTTMVGTPQLQSPTDNSNGIATNPQFEWSTVVGADHYDLMIYQGGNLIETINTTSPMVNWSGLEYCETYEWDVVAYDASGNQGLTSDRWMFETLPGDPVLSSPTDGEVNVLLDTDLEWQAVPCATEYNVTIMWGTNMSHTQTVTGTSYDYQGFEYLTDYEWYVEAVDQYGNVGPASTTWSFTTIIEQPETPSIVSPTDGEIDVPLSGTIDWDAADRASTYSVEIATDANFNTIVASASGLTETEYTYNGLDNDTEHWVRVNAANVGGTSPWSTVNSFTTILLAPPVVTNPADGEDYVLLDIDVMWNQAQGAVYYDLQLSDDANFSNLLYDETGLTGQTLSVNLSYGTTYYLRMRSVDADDNVSNWGEIMFNTIEMPMFAGPDDVCDLSIHTYQAPDIPNATYTWTVTGGTATTVDSRTIEVEWGDQTGSIKLDRTVGNLQDYTEEDITLNDLNFATVSINSYHTYQDACVNEPIVFDATIDAGGNAITSYEWNFGDGSNTVMGSANDHVFPGAGTYTVSLEITGENCTVGSATYDITIVETCPVTVTAEDLQDEDAVCQYSSPILNADVFGGNGNYTYAWRPASDFFNSTVLNAQVKQALINRTYDITVTDSDGRSGMDYATVEVETGPVVQVPAIIFPFPVAGTSINLNNKINNFDPSLTYTWHVDGQMVSDPENETVKAGLKYYFVQAQSEDGCPSQFYRMIIYGLPPLEKQVADDDIAVSANGTAFAFSYPNPVISDVTLRAEFMETSDVNIKVMDLAGRTFAEYTETAVKSMTRNINMEGLAQGTYLIVLDNGNDTIIRKVMKQ